MTSIVNLSEKMTSTTLIFCKEPKNERNFLFLQDQTLWDDRRQKRSTVMVFAIIATALAAFFTGYIWQNVSYRGPDLKARLSQHSRRQVILLDEIRNRVNSIKRKARAIHEGKLNA